MHYQRSFLALGILLCSWSASRAGPGDPETLTAQASAAVPSFPKMFQGQLDPAAPAAPADPAASDAGSPTQPPPLMIGDLFGFRARETITLPSFATTSTRITTTTTAVRTLSITTTITTTITS